MNTAVERERTPKTSKYELPDPATAVQVAEYLGVSRSQVYALNRRGVIPGSYRVGGSIRFIASAVVEWVRQGGGR